MGTKNKFSIRIFLAAFFIGLISGNIALCRSNSSEVTIMPRLAYPTGPEVTITGDYLEFKWWHGGIGVRSYEFNLYKGGGPSGDVIVQKTLPFDVSSVQVEAKLFEDGQTYTWTLRQVADDGQKSDQSFNTFRVNK